MISRSSLQPAPHLHDGASTQGMMWTVVACLVPAGVWGVILFGMRALLVIGVAVISAVVGELAENFLMRRFTIHDGSAVLSGLLIGYLLPPTVPLYLPIIGSLFAMLVVKAAFGGLGTNWINPAVGGQVFLYLAWGGALSNWSTPRFWPTGSGLQFATNGAANLIPGASPAQLLHSYPTSGFAQAISQWVSQAFQVQLDPHMVDLFAGSVPGFIGTVSPLFLLVGAIALFSLRMIPWEAPVAFVGSFFLLSWIFGGFPFIALFSGGILLVAFFLGTDPVTSPLSRGGMLVFGLGLAVLSFLLRTVGVTGEAAFIALLAMNVASPGIDRLLKWGARRIA